MLHVGHCLAGTVQDDLETPAPSSHHISGSTTAPAPSQALGSACGMQHSDTANLYWAFRLLALSISWDVLHDRGSRRAICRLT